MIKDRSNKVELSEAIIKIQNSPNKMMQILQEEVLTKMIQ